MKTPKTFYYYLFMCLALLFTACDSDDAKSSEKIILEFSILGYKGEIDEATKTISVSFPPESGAITELTPTIKFVGISVSPASEIAQDFSEPVTYTVTADDGSKAEYKVVVQLMNELDTRLTVIIINDYPVDPILADINHTTNTVSLVFPYGADITNIVPIVHIVGKSVFPASEVAQDFTKPVTYTVTGEDNKERVYDVKVIVKSEPEIRYIDKDFVGANGKMKITGFFAKSGNVLTFKDVETDAPFVPTMLSESANVIEFQIPATVSTGAYTLSVKSDNVVGQMNKHIGILSVEDSTPKIDEMDPAKVVFGTQPKLAIRGTNLKDIDGKSAMAVFTSKATGKSVHAATTSASAVGTIVSLDCPKGLAVGVYDVHVVFNEGQDDEYKSAVYTFEVTEK